MSRERKHLLIINPGSTSTKVALYADDSETAVEEIHHDAAVLQRFPALMDQEAFRYDLIKSVIRAWGLMPPAVDAVMGRGGLLHPLESGVYEITEDMLQDLRSCRYGEHASNLGAILAERFGRLFDCPAWIADPVVVDELDAAARVSGMPEIERVSIFHALNQKSAGRWAAASLGISYEEGNFIVAHLGGGVSVGAHIRGRVVDVNNALDGDGPFSPERSGGVPAGQLLRLAISGLYTERELRRKITGEGGMYAYLGTKDMRSIEKAVQRNDSRAKLLVQAMAYQISKEICSLLPVIGSTPDAVILTGGLVKMDSLCKAVVQAVSPFANVLLLPGEREMFALAENGLAVLNGFRKTKQYANSRKISNSDEPAASMYS